MELRDQDRDATPLDYAIIYGRPVANATARYSPTVTS